MVLNTRIQLTKKIDVFSLKLKKAELSLAGSGVTKYGAHALLREMLLKRLVLMH